MTRLKQYQRIVLRAALGLVAAALLSAGAVMAAIANPQPFFRHSITAGAVTIRAAHPISAAAVPYLETLDITPRMGMAALDGHYTVYLAEDGWRARLFFGLAPMAGGITFAGLAPNHAFLSGADFEAGLLIKGENRIAPPRDLAYYLRHEANHLALCAELGLVDYVLLPAWVREGIADLAALGPPDRGQLAEVLGDAPITLDHMRAFGAYPRARLLADWVLETQGYDALLQSDWTEDEALAHFMERDG